MFAEAQNNIPGGVDSPVRAFRAVGGNPHFIARGEGSRIFDVDGNSFIDYVASWGPLILGHAPASVVTAINAAAKDGTSFGAPTERETILAKMVRAAYPSIELVRFVNSGTEATMSALRLARGYTGREKIVKFDGGYHGHADGLLVAAGSGSLTLGVPDSAGVPETMAASTLSAPYNDLATVEKLFAAYAGQIAAVILEPVAGNMGVVPPAPGFLEGLRKVTAQDGALLIFDEVITGFRVAYGGAQSLYGVIPDITCLGKIIGGGLPVGAYGGRREIMEKLAPLGPVYQAGTLAGNPLAMAAGIAALQSLQKPGVYEALERRSVMLAEGMAAAAKRRGVPVYSTRVASMMTTFFTSQKVTDYVSAKTSDAQAYARWFRAMLEQGVYFAPSQFEAGFVSLAHTDEDIESTVAAADKAFQELV
jgi:glutamate-1-semialdehyde 2,1-aminomutase